MKQLRIADHIPIDRRKEIFQTLLEAQDEGMSVPKSRQKMVDQFGVTEAEVRQIESEGLEGEWPPL